MNERPKIEPDLPSPPKGTLCNSLLHSEPLSPTRKWLGYVAVLLVAGAVYIWGCAPDVLMQDPGWYQRDAYHLTLYRPGYLARVHPLYTLLAHGFTHLPLENVAYKVNLLSCVAGAFTCANVFVIIMLLTGRIRGAVVGTLGIMLAHTFWIHSEIAEVLTLAALLLTIELLLLLSFIRTRKVGYLLLTFFANGLALSNHPFALLSLACYGFYLIVIFAKRHIRLAHFLGCIGTWLAGSGLMWALFVYEAITRNSFSAAVKSAFVAGSGGRVFSIGITAQTMKTTVLTVALNYPTLLWAAGLLGLVVFLKARQERTTAFKWVFAATSAVFFAFAARYTVPDQYAFFTPFLALMAIYIGIGAGWLTARWRGAFVVLVILALAPVAVYALLPHIAKDLKIDLGAQALKYRDPYYRFLRPWQRGYFDGARRYCEEAFDILPKGSVLLTDDTVGGAVIYLQDVEGQRQDILLLGGHGSLFGADFEKINQYILENPEQPIYTTDPARLKLTVLRDKEVAKIGILYKVVP